MIADGIKLAPCHWGYCVYVEQLSACHGDESGPNEIERSPDVCARCSNFAVTEAHRPWWEARFRADEVFLQKVASGSDEKFRGAEIGALYRVASSD